VVTQCHFVELRNEQGIVKFKEKEFEAKMNEKIRLILINYPHNPTAKVFDAQELEFIRRMVLKYPQVVVVSDEVYVYLGYDSTPIKSFATLPDLYDRTLSIYSVGKTFSACVKELRFGYAIANPTLLEYARKFNAQKERENIAPRILDNLYRLLCAADNEYKGEESFYKWNNKLMQLKKDRITNALRSLGLEVLDSLGGFFAVVNIEPSIPQVPVKYYYRTGEGLEEKTLASFEDWYKLPFPCYRPDYAFCRYLAIEKGIILWPLSGFADSTHSLGLMQTRAGASLARVALARTDEMISQLEALVKAPN
jgi:aspartate/methionine/tyrosine aminotransferase